MTLIDAATVAGLVANVCCVVCAVELVRDLTRTYPEIPWHSLVRESDPHPDLLSFLDDPEGYHDDN